VTVSCGSGDLVSDVKSLTDRVECLAVSPDDRLVAAGSSTGAVWLVDAVTGQVAKEAVAGSERVLVVAFAPSGDSLMAVDVGGNLRIWRLPDLAVSEELQLAHPPDPATSWMDSALLSSAAFSPSGQNVAFGWTDGRVSLWRMEGTELLWEGQGQEIDIDALAFSADEALLASGTNGGERRIWHVADGAMSPPLEAEGLLTSVTAAAFGPTDGLVAFTSLRGVDLCSSSDLVALRQLAAAEDPGRTAAVFSPDGQLLAAGGAHGQVDLWNVEEGSQVTVLSGHADYVLAAAFSPSGRYLATSSIDGTVRLWGVPSGSGLVLGNGS
jgi:WD40 repeat protein